MSQGSYAYEKLMGAAHTLATGSGPMPARLEDAATYLIARLHQPGDFPPELQRRWDELKGRLTCKEPRDSEGSIQATIREMDESELRKAAEEIWALFSELGSIATQRM